MPPEKQALLRAARVLGSQAALATLLGFSDRRNVSPYFTTPRQFPPEHCPAVELATREKGEPVYRWELRPNDWHRIWPELIGADGAPEPAESGG